MQRCDAWAAEEAVGNRDFIDMELSDHEPQRGLWNAEDNVLIGSANVAKRPKFVMDADLLVRIVEMW